MVAFEPHVDSTAAVKKRDRSQSGQGCARTRRGSGTVVSVLVSGCLSVLLVLPSGAADFEPASTETWEIPQANLYDVAVVGDSVWAVGYWGTALRSTDRGETWSRSPTPTDENLYAVAFADVGHGWAVGAAGTVLRSENGGRSWETVQVEVADEMGGERPLDGPLFGVAAISPTEAWAVGDFGVVLHTRNGVQWQQVAIPEESFADDNIRERIFNSIQFTDPQHGIIVGEFGSVLRTEDAGQTWIGEKRFEGAIEDTYLFDVGPNGRGVAVSGGVGGVCIRTADGGFVWTSTRTHSTAGLFGAAMREQRALLVGDRGVVLLSSDGGVTWREPERPRFFNWLRGVAFGADELAFAVGERGLLIRSVDAGEHWEWKLGRQPGPEAGVSVPDPGARTKPQTGPVREHAQPTE